MRVARRHAVAIERHRRETHATDRDLAVLGGDVARVLGRKRVRWRRIRRRARAGVVFAHAFARRVVRIVAGPLEARAQPRDHLEVARRPLAGVGVVGVLPGQQRRAVLVIQYAGTVRRRQVRDDIRRSLVIRHRRVHVVVLVLQPERGIHVALTGRAGVRDVRRSAVMRVRQEPGHRPGRAAHAARIVVRVREVGALEHPVACKKYARFLI